MVKGCLLSTFVVNKWLNQKDILYVTVVTAIIKSCFLSCKIHIYHF